MTGIRSSLLHLLNQCKRKFFFSHHLGLRRKTSAISEALTTGTFFHAYMENGPSPEGLLATEKLYEDYLKKFNERIQLEGDPFGVLDNNINITYKSKEKGHLLASLLWRYYPEPEGTKTLFKEAELSYTLLGIKLEGRVDRVVQFPNGGVFIVDYKSTSFDPLNLLRSYKYSNALRIYRLLVMTALEVHKESVSGAKLDGFQLTVVRKPSIKFCPDSKDANKDGKFGNCWEAYLDRCKKWYDDNQMQPVVQGTLRFSDDPLNNEFYNMLTYSSPYFRVVDKEEEIDEFDRCSGACVSPWGKPCDFLDLCECNPALWERKIKELYVQEPRKVEPETIEGDVA
jgi:hypothetical protein